MGSTRSRSVPATDSTVKNRLDHYPDRSDLLGDVEPVYATPDRGGSVLSDAREPGQLPDAPRSDSSRSSSARSAYRSTCSVWAPNATTTSCGHRDGAAMIPRTPLRRWTRSGPTPHDSVVGSKSSCSPPRPMQRSGSCRPLMRSTVGPADRSPTRHSCRPCSTGRPSPTMTSLRSSTSCRQRSGRRHRRTDPLRAHVVRRRRHGGLLGAAGCRRPADRCLDGIAERARGVVANPPRHGDDRPDPRHPRRAHHVWCEGGAVGAATRSRPHSASGRPSQRRGHEVEWGRRYLLEHSAEVEKFVGDALGLEPVASTQVVARDRHAEYLYACASIGATCELMAVELRHLQRTEVREVQEGFKPGQKGSSAMPHKRNPISAETISGLARVLRSNLSAGLQDVALWHERDSRIRRSSGSFCRTRRSWPST